MSIERARLSILSELLSFPTIRNKDWTSELCDVKAEKGDLVSMSSAPASIWYLSWLVDIEIGEYETRYLLKSIENGELCWWGNVGLNFYDRKRVAEMPRWKWDDKQFQFNDRWLKVCRRNDPYFVRPCMADFDGEDVNLGTYIKFESGIFGGPKKFTNWKKTTMKMMEEYYLQCCSDYKEKVRRK